MASPRPLRFQVGQQREQAIQSLPAVAATTTTATTTLPYSRGTHSGPTILSTSPRQLEPLVVPLAPPILGVSSTNIKEINTKRQAVRTNPLTTSASGGSLPRPPAPNKDLPALPPSPTPLRQNIRGPEQQTLVSTSSNHTNFVLQREPLLPVLPAKSTVMSSAHREIPQLPTQQSDSTSATFVANAQPPVTASLNHSREPPPITALYRDASPLSAHREASPLSAHREGITTSTHREHANTTPSVSTSAGIVTSSHRETNVTELGQKIMFRGLMPGAGVANDPDSSRDKTIYSLPKLPPKPISNTQVPLVQMASSPLPPLPRRPGLIAPPRPPPPPPILQRNPRSPYRESIFSKELPPLEVGEYIHYEMDNVSQIIFRPGTCSITDNKCKMYITNFQLILYSKTKNTFIPLFAIDKIKTMIGGETNKKKTAIHLRIQNSGLGNFGFTVTCKYPYETHLVSKERTHITAFQTTLEKHVYITRIDRTFAFTYRDQISKEPVDLGRDNFGWDVYTIHEEYARLGLNSGYWRITDANYKYDLCDTYPSVLVFPAIMTNKDLIAVANFRSKRRLPAIVWKHPLNNAAISRCSQPRKGLMGNRCKEDEKLFDAIRRSGTGGELHLLDCRPIVNAYANRLKGAGVESAEHYQCCKRVFLNIENIHAMRNSLLRLTKSIIQLRMGEITEKELDASTWLEHIEFVLNGALRVAQLIDSGYSVVVHCSDGWDRTSQLCALAELMLDPHYRSIAGFELLVEKEWLAFGHMFQKRIGFGNRDERKKQRSQTAPIFLQFIDCVYQFQKQYPNAFQFNENFLVAILKHLYQGQYGTFFLNAEQQRISYQLRTKTVSLWAYINTNSAQFTNPNYYPISGVLMPRIDLKLWTNYYLAFT